MNEEIKEIVKFLKPEARLDLKAVSLIQILGLTGVKDGRNLIISTPEIVRCLILLCGDPSESVAKDACLSLVNISAEETAIPALLGAFENSKDGNNSSGETVREVISVILSIIVNPDSSSTDPACMILSNMSRPIAYCEKVLERIENSSVTLEKLIAVFCDVNYNKKGSTLDYLAPVFSNLSQLSTFRSLLRKISFCAEILFTKLILFKFADDHEWLLSDQVDILPQLLLPLAGPEEFDEEDNEKLPLDLQYLPEDKSRESDPDIRTMLLEALTKVTSCLQNIPSCHFILLGVHLWPTLFTIPLWTEEEIGEENLLDLNVPDDLTEKFSKMDDEFLQDSQ
ncbi:hypothetical protein J437_LFUL016774 [Ladona fulva]|uniref:Protein HGH1 N-terminal domain-containing protein n=1 Tax=Ladona fulva TaxID=123851 RepID=A0A8K0KKN0_LADFU|nr:hypothetical protein J437_LFUL016774 [Ladona fulva]